MTKKITVLLYNSENGNILWLVYTLVYSEALVENGILFHALWH